MELVHVLEICCEYEEVDTEHQKNALVFKF